jgi:hypothetical protein
LRGYIAGEYFTRYQVTTQSEYRELPKRFGLVVFGRVGEAIPGGQQLYGSQKFLPSGGGGLRFHLKLISSRAVVRTATAVTTEKTF